MTRDRDISYLEELLKVGAARKEDELVGPDLLAVTGEGDVNQVIILPQLLKLLGYVLLEVVPLQVEQVVVVARHLLVQVRPGHP